MQKKSIKKNMVMSIILTSANFIFPLITYSYVARVLNPSGIGKVTFVNSILSYFSYIAVLGIPVYGVREVAKIRDNKDKMSDLVQELFALNMISTVVSYIFLIFAVLFIPKLYSERMLFMVMGASIFLNTIGLEWVYQALEEYSYITIRSIIFKLISVIFTFLLIRTEKDVVFYGFVHIFTNSASYIMNFFHIKKYIRFKKKKRYYFQKHIKPILTLFAASITITIYANFDVLMIGFISSEHEVGLYNSAFKIKQIVLSLSTAVTTVLIPRMAYCLKNNSKEQVKDLIEKSFRISMDTAVPMSIYIFIFANECISFLCGNEYLSAVNTLRVLICCIVPLVLTNLFGNQILIPSGNEKRYSQSVFVGLWINLILNIIMIPKLSTLGAAIATLVTECWNVIWMSGGVKSYRSMLLRKVNYFVYGISLLMAVILSILASKVFTGSVFICLISTGIIFFVTYYIMLIVFKEPIISGQIASLRQKFQK